MVDPDVGLKLDSAYRFPANAIVEHPGLLLVVAGAGALLVLTAPRLCLQEVDPSACRGLLEPLGLSIAALAGLLYVLVVGRRMLGGRDG